MNLIASCTTSQTPYDIYASNEESSDSFQELPEEIIMHIFSNFNHNQLFVCSQVNRKWQRWSSDKNLWNSFDIDKIFPSIEVIDEKFWEKHVNMKKHGLTCTDISRPDMRKMIFSIKKMLSLKIERDAGITILTIPYQLSLKRLIEVGKNPKQGHTTLFQEIWEPFLASNGDKTVEKTYMCAITNHVIENSRKIPLREEDHFVHQLECSKPKVLEIATLLVMKHIATGQRLYDDAPWTFSSCTDTFGKHDLYVGGFGENGIRIVNSCSFDYECIGLGAKKML